MHHYAANSREAGSCSDSSGTPRLGRVHAPGNSLHIVRASSLVLLLMLTGCSVCQQARRTLLEEPAQYSWKKDRKRSLATYQEWAASAWYTESGQCAENVQLDEFGAGFRDGFVDVVYAGGSGEPPPVPPRQFWNVGWRSPEGHAAADQWFAGYRRGAQVALEGGFRQRATLISSYRQHGDVAWQGPQFESPVPAPFEDLGAPPDPVEVETPAPTLPLSPPSSLPAPQATSATELSPELIADFQSALRGTGAPPSTEKNKALPAPPP